MKRLGYSQSTFFKRKSRLGKIKTWLLQLIKKYLKETNLRLFFKDENFKLAWSIKNVLSAWRRRHNVDDDADADDADGDAAFRRWCNRRNDCCLSCETLAVAATHGYLRSCQSWGNTFKVLIYHLLASSVGIYLEFKMPIFRSFMGLAFINYFNFLDYEASPPSTSRQWVSLLSRLYNNVAVLLVKSR